MEATIKTHDRAIQPAQAMEKQRVLDVTRIKPTVTLVPV